MRYSVNIGHRLFNSSMLWCLMEISEMVTLKCLVEQRPRGGGHLGLAECRGQNIHANGSFVIVDIRLVVQLARREVR